MTCGFRSSVPVQVEQRVKGMLQTVIRGRALTSRGMRLSRRHLPIFAALAVGVQRFKQAPVTRHLLQRMFQVSVFNAEAFNGLSLSHLRAQGLQGPTLAILTILIEVSSPKSYWCL
mmetsp:Transcript_13662/g.47395  ORF Transcript_13662/g.47395 Transcript_13662/m.47395 type:complete len:116 (+) Transcript_13662:1645-1992(+)